MTNNMSNICFLKEELLKDLEVKEVEEDPELTEDELEEMLTDE